MIATDEDDKALVAGRYSGDLLVEDGLGDLAGERALFDFLEGGEEEACAWGEDEVCFVG